MTPKATNIFAEIKALRMEFEFCYMGVEHVGHLRVLGLSDCGMGISMIRQ